MAEERAILAGGCFWGMQDLFRKLPGVAATRVGYTGGDVPNATYRNHGTHAEGIEILFDPAKISYRRILEYFFQIHDPTTLNRQGNDRGMSYRSAIYYTSEAQRQVALDTIADVDASGLWPGKVVTEVEPAGDFWEAEPEHQDYLERYPQGYTCHFPREEWVLPGGQSATHGELRTRVSAAITAADPTRLIEMGAPSDEYDPEVATILPRLKEATSATDVQQIVFEEFEAWFGPDSHSFGQFEELAEEIWAIEEEHRRYLEEKHH